jgi:hypothetical protein
VRIKLTDKTARELPFVQRTSKVTFDAELTGFAVRATVKAKAFVLNCHIDGVRRQFSIGSFS